MGNTKYTKGGWKIINGWDKDGNGKYFPSVILFGDEVNYCNGLIFKIASINKSNNVCYDNKGMWYSLKNCKKII